MDDGYRLYDRKGSWVIVIKEYSVGDAHTMLQTTKGLLKEMAQSSL